MLQMSSTSETQMPNAVPIAMPIVDPSPELTQDPMHQLNDAALESSSIVSKMEKVSGVLGIGAGLPLPEAVQAARTAMQITPSGTLVEQVNHIYASLFSDKGPKNHDKN